MKDWLKALVVGLALVVLILVAGITEAKCVRRPRCLRIQPLPVQIHFHVWYDQRASDTDNTFANLFRDILGQIDIPHTGILLYDLL